MLVLGIETSCDETAAAIVDDESIRSSVVASQVDLHARFGGVVPELASRAHVELLDAVLTEALAQADCDWADLDAVAATEGPGLSGALLVGVSAAKTIAFARDVPYVGVNHLDAHLQAAWLEQPDLALPAMGLLVSGGHTLLAVVDAPGSYRLLGSTVDDAVGEAFDKVARLLGLVYPGGPEIDRVAADGDPKAVAFPRPMLRDGWDFSFAGLKTAVAVHCRDHPGDSVADVAASFREAAVDVLARKLDAAAAEYDVASVVLAGGVAANARLRERVAADAHAAGRQVFLPSPALCTDNAAMVAATGFRRLAAGRPTALSAGVDPGLGLLGDA